MFSQSHKAFSQNGNPYPPFLSGSWISVFNEDSQITGSHKNIYYRFLDIQQDSTYRLGIFRHEDSVLHSLDYYEFGYLEFIDDEWRLIKLLEHAENPRKTRFSSEYNYSLRFYTPSEAEVLITRMNDTEEIMKPFSRNYYALPDSSGIVPGTPIVDSVLELSVLYGMSELPYYYAEDMRKSYFDRKPSAMGIL